MRIRATVTALLVVATLGASLFAASSAGAQTPTATPTSVALAPCPTGATLTVAAPTAAAPSTVTATIVPALTNLPQACTFAPRCAFADDKCRGQFPPYEEKAPAHWAACWHSDRLTEAGDAR